MIKPIYKDNYVTLVLSSSNAFLPYLSVLLESLRRFSSKENNYDIIVFEDSITEQNKKILKNFIETDNISLRFYNPSKYFEDVNLKAIVNLRNINSFYRILIPMLMSEYDKVIFTDTDLIFNADLMEITKIDLDNYMLGCIVEPVWEIEINKNNKEFIDYTKDVLNLDNPYNYYNTGVIIFDIKKCNVENFTQTIFNELTPEKFVYKWQEQCIITKLFNNKIKKIPFSWNYDILDESFFKILSKETVDYVDTKEKNIIHFIGGNKPWFDMKLTPYHELWWDYAKNSPYYPVISEYLLKILQKNIKKYISRCFIYGLLKIVTFGKTKLSYISKFNKFKTKIDAYNALKKNRKYSYGKNENINFI